MNLKKLKKRVITKSSSDEEIKQQLNAEKQVGKRNRTNQRNRETKDTSNEQNYS